MAKNSVKHSVNSYEKLKKGNMKKRAAVLGLLSVMTITGTVPALAATTTTADTSTGITVSTEAVSDQTLSVSTFTSIGQVTGLSYTVLSDTEYELTWNAVSGVTGYMVYRKEAGSDRWVKVNTVTGTYHIAGSALTAGHYYSFRVRAYKTENGTTTYGAYSNTIGFTFKGSTSSSSDSSSSSNSSSDSSSSSTVAVTGVSLNKSSVSIKAGKTKTLKATVTPSNATNSKVTWSSSKKSVATVSSSGVITAKKKGTAVITAKTANGKKATCKVKVTAAGSYKSVTAAYTKLNNFRTKKGVWYWNKNNTTKTVYNTSGKTYLSKLTKSSSLEKTAKTRAKEIATKFSHTRPNGTPCKTAFASSYTVTGECIAYGYNTAAEVIEAWKEADENYSGQDHRRNMLSTKFTQVGIACYEVNGVKYWVMDLGAK